MPDKTKADVDAAVALLEAQKKSGDEIAEIVEKVFGLAERAVESAKLSHDNTERLMAAIASRPAVPPAKIVEWQSRLNDLAGKLTVVLALGTFLVFGALAARHAPGPEAAQVAASDFSKGLAAQT
ncbi:MAG TPA: hypothetical protein VJJ20_03975 [Candidatus Paceibacterota bacterium]